ncbi:MAG: GtrA family protein [Bacteroidetes bacterium]|nr:GtrA family protein [Bacteroidota bacterium]
MLTFLKANVASLIASACDYGMTVLAVQGLGMQVVAGGVTGTVTGGIINFWINRQWVFSASDTRAHKQAIRYAIIWVGNLLLNAMGMYLLTKEAGMFYVGAKLLSSILVAVGYNYPLQKRYVFKSN